MKNIKKIKIPGIQKKIIAIVIASVGLSIGISTVINLVVISNTLTQNAGEKIFLISRKTHDIVMGKIDKEFSLLRLIASSPYTQQELASANLFYRDSHASLVEERSGIIDRDWNRQAASAEILKSDIENTPLSQYLRDLQSTEPSEVEMFITDKQGFIIAMSNRTTDYWQADEEWWQQAASGKIYISSPLYDESSHYWALNIAVPVYKNGNQTSFAGVVRGTIDITSLLEEIFNIEFGESGRGFFVSNDGKIYSRLGESLDIREVPENYHSRIDNLQDGWTGDFPDIDGIDTVAAIHNLEYDGQNIGKILILMKQSELKTILLSTIKENLFIAFLLIVILSVIGSFSANSILRILNTLNKEVSLIAKGDYSHSFSKSIATSTDPDIQSLVESVSSMSSAVQDREKALQANEKKYRHLVETMNEGLLMLNEVGTVMYANPRISEMLGFSLEEIIGTSYFQFIAEKEISNTAFQWTLREDGFQHSYETALLKKSGEELHVLISPQRLVNEENEFTGSLAVVTDISRNKEVELTQQKKIEELASLRRIDTAILSGNNLKSVIEVILEQFKNELKADAVSIHIFHPHSTRVRLSKAFIQNKKITCAKNDIHHRRIHEHIEDNAGCLYTADINDQILWEKLSEIDIKTLYIAPILVGENRKGILEAAFTSTVNINDEWLSYFNALITQTAVGIEKTELVEVLQTRNKELQEAYLSTIKGWANALELRDEETRGHSDRVVQMALDMAIQFGFTGEALENFRNGALLHDIGKMGVPDGILLKPGKLTDEEWVIMKKHPVFAYNLLKGIPFLNNALEIPYYHHERWNGSGYPHGLQGESIPLSARIFAVVDVWDALTSDRPYRPAWSRETTAKYLIENKGIQFDPHVVDVFLDMISRKQEPIS